MPWRTTTVDTERAEFIIEARNSDLSHAELCRRFAISRKDRLQVARPVS